MAQETDSKESFVGRWARVKQARAQGLAVAEPVVEQKPAVPAAPVEAAQPAVPPPELPPVESLTTESDFTPFMRAGVSALTRNAAVKKLFSDPHFNVMDRLDIYIDDYSIPDPLPPGMLEQLEHCKSTLFPQPWQDQAEPEVVAKVEEVAPQPETAVDAAQEESVQPLEEPAAVAADAQANYAPQDEAHPTEQIEEVEADKNDSTQYPRAFPAKNA
ncbi:MAG: DUF3306 domain-containing protein [Burkholderiaceae bacterium]